MSYKNTMKLFVSNFTLAWKQLLYLLMCVFLFALCSYTLVSPIVTILKEAGISGELKNLISLVYNNPKDIALTLSEIVKLVLNSLLQNFSKIYLNIFGTIILCLILPYILFEVSVYNVSSILYQKFTMNMEVGYCQNLISNLGKAIKFALTSLLFSLPFFVCNVVLIITYIFVANSVLKAIIGLIILSLISLILSSVKLTLFSHFTGNVVANDINSFKAFLKSFSIEIKHFWKIMSSSIVTLLTAILINGVIAIFTFFAGLIFTIPATFVLISIFKIVTFLNINGNRYYLSNSVIFNPQKYVVKKDEYVSSFIPPEETKEITTTKMRKKYKTKTLNEKSNKSKKTNKKIKG